MAGAINRRPASPQSFGKAERLNSKKLMDELFNKGSSFVLYPFRVYYLKHEQPVPSQVQVMMGVSKKNFASAVDRNRVKRLMRESYRKNKNIIGVTLSAETKNLAVAFLFSDKKLPEYKFVEQKMIAALNSLTEKIK